jgi:anti-sigma factor RsiW
MREKLAYHDAPPDLAARIGSALAQEAPAPRVAPARRVTWSVLPVGGAGFAGALAGVALMLFVARGGGGSLDVALVDSQVRSLMADHLTDVLTSDRHTVKPWLASHADVSPPVPDLAQDGFPLIGGRLDYVAGKRAAVAVYRRDKHVINLFAWPEAQDTPLRMEKAQGFNIFRWSAGGIAYAAVSDVEADQLRAFVRDYIARSA